jgi:hypothetical protein
VAVVEVVADVLDGPNLPPVTSSPKG